MSLLSTARMKRCEHCGHATLTRPDETPVGDKVLMAITKDLDGAPHDCWEFFEALFGPEVIDSAKALAHKLGVTPSTLTSRFWRAGLPSPKMYVTHALLVRAAHLLEQPDLSVSRVALELHQSSAQSFTRTIRTFTGLTAAQFRKTVNGDTALDVFRRELILPHVGALKEFHPLHATELNAGGATKRETAAEKSALAYANHIPDTGEAVA
jgi:AraC-like DNA-binding protein